MMSRAVFAGIVAGVAEAATYRQTFKANDTKQCFTVLDPVGSTPIGNMALMDCNSSDLRQSFDDSKPNESMVSLHLNPGWKQHPCLVVVDWGSFFGVGYGTEEEGHCAPHLGISDGGYFVLEHFLGQESMYCVAGDVQGGRFFLAQCKGNTSDSCEGAAVPTHPEIVCQSGWHRDGVTPDPDPPLGDYIHTITVSNRKHCLAALEFGTSGTGLPSFSMRKCDESNLTQRWKTENSNSQMISALLDSHSDNPCVSQVQVGPNQIALSYRRVGEGHCLGGFGVKGGYWILENYQGSGKWGCVAATGTSSNFFIAMCNGSTETSCKDIAVPDYPDRKCLTGWKQEPIADAQELVV